MRMLILLLATSLLAACATTAPTVETYTSYRIYEVSRNYSLDQVRDAVVTAAKEANSNAVVNNNILPHPLPEKPGRFAIKDMQFGPVSMQFPQMPGATISVSSDKTPNGGAHESMNWVVGIYPYQGGYSVQMVMVARYQRGTSGFDPVSIGAVLGRELAYKQSGGIEGRIKHWFDDFTSKVSNGLNISLLEEYPES